MPYSASGGLGHDGLAPGHVAVELDDPRIGRAADRVADELLRARERRGPGELALQDARGQRDGVGEPCVLLGRVELLVPHRIHGGDDAAHRHRADVVDQRLGDRLARVVGVDALHEPLVDGRRGLETARELLAVGAPHEPEARVADPVGPLAGAALLMVVEVAGGGIGAAADVDAQVGGVLHGLVAGADDVQGAVDEAQHGDREDVVGVEVAGMGGDAHGPPR